MMLREAGSILCDDVLLMICTRIDDIFYVRTKGDCADVIAQELPGCRVRRCLIDEMDEHEAQLRLTSVVQQQQQRQYIETEQQQQQQYDAR